MAEPEHREQAAKALHITSSRPEVTYNPGGQVGLLHEQIEQQLGILAIPLNVPRRAMTESLERLIHSVSRACGPIALGITYGIVLWGVMVA
ncbi:hypothetical protein [Sphingomonas sp. 35-24ZXX]|uniref:hypothetical protein n=1 Tax=Sphingomonas sp. 35-24ZXX TaxID=1545915 RepID=UPI0012E06496|nr:hypothetical protein [Sphingomonas sp. 35-24ZXX]